MEDEWKLIGNIGCMWIQICRCLLHKHQQSFTVIYIDQLTPHEYDILKPENHRTSPIVYKNNVYFGDFRKVRDYFQDEYVGYCLDEF